METSSTPTTSSLPPMPTTPTVPTIQKPPVSKKLPLPAILAVIAGIAVIGVASYYFYQQYSNSKGSNNQYASNEQNQSNNTETTTPTPEQEAVKPTSNTLFYIGGTNYDIFSVNPDTLAKEQLTTFSEKNMVDAQVINGDKLGYATCLTTTGNFNCQLHTISLPDKTDSKILTLEADKYMVISGWYLPNIFAHSSTFNKGAKDERQNLILSTNGTTKQLEELVNNTGSSTGRGGFDGDSSKIKFSADGKFLFKIDTGNVLNGMDFNIYLFGTDTDVKKKIADATHPVWMNTNTILYSSIKSGRTEKLFTYNINTLEETVHEVGKTIIGQFSLMNDQVLYKSSDSAIYLFNMTTKENKKIIDNAMNPVWIKSNLFVYTETAKCGAGDDSCGMVDYTITGVKIFNTATNETKTVTSSPTEISSYFTVYSK